MIRIETARLILREWEEQDLAPFAAMNADPRVMEFFPSTLTEAESLERIERIGRRVEEDGFSFMPVEEKATGRFAGFVGLGRLRFVAPFTPAVEVGWRLPVAFWGKGYASEAARAWLGYGFDTLGLDEIVAISVAANHRSHTVMKRLGMVQDETGSFMHPEIDPSSGLAFHLLHRKHRKQHRD